MDEGRLDDGGRVGVHARSGRDDLHASNVVSREMSVRGIGSRESDRHDVVGGSERWYVDLVHLRG